MFAIDITGTLLWSGLNTSSVNVTDLNLDAGPLSFANITETGLDITFEFGSGVVGGTDMLVTGVTGCSATTSWRGWLDSYLTSAPSSCRIQTTGDMIVDGYSKLFEGQIADSNHFTLHYALAPAVPEPSPWLLFACGMALILRKRAW